MYFNDNNRNLVLLGIILHKSTCKYDNIHAHPQLHNVQLSLKYLSTAKQGDNALGSVRLSVRSFVCLFVCVRSPV